MKSNNRKPSHIVYLNPAITDPALSIISQFCGKGPDGKPVLLFMCSEVDDSHPFYLHITACFANNDSKKFMIPNSLVLLVYENKEHQEGLSVPFGFVPPQVGQVL